MKLGREFIKQLQSKRSKSKQFQKTKSGSQENDVPLLKKTKRNSDRCFSKEHHKQKTRNRKAETKAATQKNCGCVHHEYINSGPLCFKKSETLLIRKERKVTIKICLINWC
jgi:hypothetical protein